MDGAVKTYDSKKGCEVTVGTIQGNTFIKKVTNRHYMRKFQGYGIDAPVLSALRINGVTCIIIECKFTKYSSIVSDWIKFGIKHDFGHGEQFFLAVSYMTLISK